MNYLFLLSKDFIGLACRLLSSVFIVRHLGPEIFGSYVFVMLILAYFQNFGRIPISISILPYLKTNPNDEKIIFSLSFFLNGIMGLITSLMLILVSTLFGLFDNYSNWIYLLLSLMIFGEFYLVMISYAFSFRSQFKNIAILSNIRSIILAGGYAWVYFYTQQKSIFPFLIVNVLELLIGAFIGFILIRDYINLSFLEYKKLDLKLYTRTSLKFYLADKARFFSDKTLITIVAAKLSSSSLAYFNMLFHHFTLLQFPNNALGTIMYPKLAKEKSDVNQRKYIAEKIKFNFLIYMPILIAAYYVYPKLVIIFYGNEFEPIIKYFPYLLTMGAAYLIIYPISHYFTSNGAPQYGALIGFFGLLSQIASVVFFLYSKDFTLLSAVISQSIGFIGLAISMIIIYNFKSFEIKNE